MHRLLPERCKVCCYHCHCCTGCVLEHHLSPERLEAVTFVIIGVLEHRHSPEFWEAVIIVTIGVLEHQFSLDRSEAVGAYWGVCPHRLSPERREASCYHCHYWRLSASTLARTLTGAVTGYLSLRAPTTARTMSGCYSIVATGVLLHRFSPERREASCYHCQYWRLWASTLAWTLRSCYHCYYWRLRTSTLAKLLRGCYHCHYWCLKASTFASILTGYCYHCHYLPLSALTLARKLPERLAVIIVTTGVLENRFSPEL